MLRGTFSLALGTSRSSSTRLGWRSLVNSASNSPPPTASFGDHLNVDYVSLVLVNWKTERYHQASRSADFGDAVQLSLTPSLWRASVKYNDRGTMGNDEWIVTWGEGSTKKAAQKHAAYHACSKLGLLA
ncbi:hypothetical protein BCR35DRAFT_334282 [Leucosporidium creatinivorum]|uniref:Uncharacterized protein n=1 Tax=Leucosporidium creatinivorum TaxID=106004 RepID=A0A1Y2ECZ6_9BASI|nr:hypothetical protein BCR35DRAFT_334282 [Leucosporidium creatinivorum]